MFIHFSRFLFLSFHFKCYNKASVCVFRQWSRCNGRRHTTTTKIYTFKYIYLFYSLSLVHSNNGITFRSKNPEIKHLQNGICGSTCASDAVAHCSAITSQSSSHYVLRWMCVFVCMAKKSATDTISEQRIREKDTKKIVHQKKSSPPKKKERKKEKSNK